MASIAFYPLATEELLLESGVSAGDYRFSFEMEGSRLPLSQSGRSTVKLSDPNELWGIESEGLILDRQVVIEYPMLLKGSNGIAPSGSELSICIVWNNKALTQMGYIKPLSVSTQNTSLYLNFHHVFKPGEISGDLTLDTVFYIKLAAAAVLPEEENLINRAGVTLGEIDSLTLSFAEDFMEFPIVEVNDKNAPLWWLDITQWDDPTVDPFTSDYVCLYLNNAYSHCPKAGSTTKGQDLLVEIISTCYLMLFQELVDRDCIDRTINNVDLEPGSIAKVLYYFVDSCDPALRTGSISEMQKTIRTNVERMLSEAEDEL